MTRILTSPWVTALLSAVIYLGATVAFWKNPERPADFRSRGGGVLGDLGPRGDPAARDPVMRQVESSTLRGNASPVFWAATVLAAGLLL